uniref:PEP-CTERM sorting domain-containing protein n=1 Tax=Desulfacinum infernum TaxID=35837 RepID=A0A831ZZC8_9BACT
MKRSLLLCLLAAACILSAVPYSALATPLTLAFGDSSKYWPGWGNTDNDSWPGKDNNLDTIGDPNFTEGTVQVVDWYLTEIQFTFEKWGTGNGWNKLEPGDLLLSIDGDTNWEYVVYADNNTNKLDGKTPSSWDYNLYAIDIALDNKTAYEMSGIDKTGYWSGYLIRDNHPIGLKSKPAGSFLGDVGFAGWGTRALTFTFPSGKIYLGDGVLTIGFAVNCANDVIYETLELPRPPQHVAPEPASMLLMGTGLVGLAGYVRARRKNTQKNRS